MAWAVPWPPGSSALSLEMPSEFITKLIFLICCPSPFQKGPANSEEALLAGGLAGVSIHELSPLPDPIAFKPKPQMQQVLVGPCTVSRHVQEMHHLTFSVPWGGHGAKLLPIGQMGRLRPDCKGQSGWS